MKFTCPNCRQPLLPENINVQTDLALCKACGQVSQLSKLVDADFDPAVLDHPPPGAWYQESMSECIFGATTRSPMAFFLVPFMCVWSGGSLGGIYGTQLVHGKFNLMISLFGIPFLIGTLMFGSIALMSVCGKLEVRIREGLGTVFIGVGRLGWTRRFNLAEVDFIEDSYTPGSRGSGSTSILLRGQSVLRFGSQLTEPRRYFILNVLKRLKAGSGASPRNLG